MSEIEKIQRYIERTRFPQKDYYYLSYQEIEVFYQEFYRDSFRTMLTLFDYGRAKGLRAARREAARHE